MTSLIDAFVVSIVPPAIRRQAYRRMRTHLVTVAIAALAGAAAFTITAVTIVARDPQRFEPQGKIQSAGSAILVKTDQNERPATFEERFSAVYDKISEPSPTWANSGEKLDQLTWKPPQLSPLNLNAEPDQPTGFSKRSVATPERERGDDGICGRYHMRKVWVDRWTWRCRRGD